jgi:hypothetical protein
MCLLSFYIRNFLCPIFSVLLVIDIKLEAKYRFRVAVMLLFDLQNVYLNESLMTFKIYCHSVLEPCTACRSNITTSHGRHVCTADDSA